MKETCPAIFIYQPCCHPQSLDLTELRTPSSETFTSQTRRLGGFRTATDQTYASMLARLIYFDADIVLLGDLAEVFAGFFAIVV